MSYPSGYGGPLGLNTYEIAEILKLLNKIAKSLEGINASLFKLVNKENKEKNDGREKK